MRAGALIVGPSLSTCAAGRYPPGMPRNDASRLYMAAQVQGRTLERQADGLRQRLCALSSGQGDLGAVLTGIEAMRLQLLLAEHLARELAEISGVRALPG